MPRQMTNFRIDPELLQALRAIRQRDGLPIAEQIRRAIRTWLEARGAVEGARRRVPPRRKA